MVDDSNTYFIVLEIDPKGHLFLWVDACSHCNDVSITILDDFSFIVTFEVHVLNHIVYCVVDVMHCEYREK